MRDLIRRQLRRAGYDLHRFLPTSSPDAQVAQTLRKLGIDLVLDVGANVGQYGQLIRELGYTGRIVSFEPLPVAHAALTANAARDAAWTIAPRAAIGDRDGEIDINVAGNSASSSVLDMLGTHSDAAPESAYVGKERVTLSRLDAAAEPYVCGARNVFVKVDTQGYEAAVVRGGPIVFARAAAVQIELSMVPLYAGQPLWDEMIALMGTQGLVLWALWPGFADPASGRLLQVDAIFARDPGGLERFPGEV